MFILFCLSAVANSFILSYSVLFVKHFLKLFFKTFFWFTVPLFSDPIILSLLKWFVNNFFRCFLIFYSVFSDCFCRFLTPVTSDLYIIAPHSPFVNNFFQKKIQYPQTSIEFFNFLSFVIFASVNRSFYCSIDNTFHSDCPFNFTIWSFIL